MLKRNVTLSGVVPPDLADELANALFAHARSLRKTAGAAHPRCRHSWEQRAEWFEASAHRIRGEATKARNQGPSADQE